MEKFVNKLKTLDVEPRNSSWLKLENRLQDDRYYAKDKSDHQLKYSMIAASVVLLLCAGYFLFNVSSDNLQALDGFMVESMEKNSMNNNDIYNIDQLKELNTAYQVHGLSSEQIY